MTARQMQFKDFRDVVLKADDEGGGGLVEGYASRYNVVDKQNDVVLPGAYKSALAQAPNRIRFLWGHDRNRPIGSITQLKDDDQGLWFQARFAATITKAQETRELMMMDPPGLDSFSVGLEGVKAARGQWNGRPVTLIKEARLFEISAVPFPCNVDARMTRVKGELESQFADLALDEQQLVGAFLAFLEQRRTKSEEPSRAEELVEAVELAIEEPETLVEQVVTKSDEDVGELLAALELHRLHAAISRSR